MDKVELAATGAGGYTLLQQLLLLILVEIGFYSGGEGFTNTLDEFLKLNYQALVLLGTDPLLY